MSGCLVRVRGRTSFRRRWKKRVIIGGDGKEAEENDQQQELDEEKEEEGENVIKDDKFFESFEKSDSTFLRRPRWKEIRRKLKRTKEEVSPSEGHSLSSSYETPRIIIS